MDAARWDSLVRRLDAEAQRDPSGYRRRVAALAALGYAYVFGVLAVLVALIAVIGYVALERPILIYKLGLPLAAFALLILRSMWVRIPPPEGIELSRGEAPELWRLVDELRRKVDGPKVHKLLMDGDLNASVVQVPRLGIFGWQRNYLTVGLPLLHALSPDEFAAVIAHELGHLSKAHGRFGAWIYRLQETWARLLEALKERRSLGSFIFTKFFEWYSPHFAAYSFSLRRAHEYEADRASAEATSAQTAAKALAGVTAAAAYLEERFWPEVYRRSDDEAEPPAQTYSVLARELPEARRRDEAQQWVQAALRAESDTLDTHPALSQRLAVLQVDPVELGANGAGETAAQRYLGPDAERAASQLDELWQRSILPAWHHEYVQAQGARDKLAQLDRDAERQKLDVEALRERAALTERFRGDEEALTRWSEVLEREPEDAQAHFNCGRLLLARGSDTGLSHLDWAIEHEADAVLPACELAYAYLVERGREQEAERYRQRAERHAGVLDAAADERAADPSEQDDLAPPDLPKELIDEVRRRVARHEGVAKAYLVRKRLRHLDDEYPLYVIGIVPKHRWRTLWKDADDDNEEGSLAERVADDLELPIDFQVVVPGPRSGISARFEEIEGALIFSRED